MDSSGPKCPEGCLDYTIRMACLRLIETLPSWSKFSCFDSSMNLGENQSSENSSSCPPSYLQMETLTIPLITKMPAARRTKPMISGRFPPTGPYVLVDEIGPTAGVFIDTMNSNPPATKSPTPNRIPKMILVFRVRVFHSCGMVFSSYVLVRPNPALMIGLQSLKE